MPEGLRPQEAADKTPHSLHSRADLTERQHGNKAIQDNLTAANHTAFLTSDKPKVFVCLGVFCFFLGGGGLKTLMKSIL